MSRIRDAFLNHTPEVDTVVVELDGQELKVEVRQRTVKQQYELLDKVRKKNGDIDGMLLAVETIISTCYDPDTGNQVFDPADRDALLNMDMAPFQVLLQAANRAAGLQSEGEVAANLDGADAATSSG